MQSPKLSFRRYRRGDLPRIAFPVLLLLLSVLLMFKGAGLMMLIFTIPFSVMTLLWIWILFFDYRPVLELDPVGFRMIYGKYTYVKWEWVNTCTVKKMGDSFYLYFKIKKGSDLGKMTWWYRVLHGLGLGDDPLYITLRASALVVPSRKDQFVKLIERICAKARAEQRKKLIEAYRK